MPLYLHLCAGRRDRFQRGSLYIGFVVFLPVDKALPPIVSSGPRVPTDRISKISDPTSKIQRRSKVQLALYAVPFVSLRRLLLSITAVLSLFAIAGGLPLAAQDDITTRNATSGYNGAYITGPASNPLSFLNGAAFRTTGNPAPYDFHDFAPATNLTQSYPSGSIYRPRSGSGTRGTAIQASRRMSMTPTC